MIFLLRRVAIAAIGIEAPFHGPFSSPSREENELGVVLPLSKAAREHLLDVSDGDGRVLLNLVEQISSWNLVQEIDLKILQNGLNKRATAYDKAGEYHYNLISALHKSVLK